MWYKVYGIRNAGKILSFVLLFFLLRFVSAFAYQGDYGTESVFMSGAGSRPDAMAGAFTAVADDLSAIHFNPAGLANIQKQGISLLYYPLYESASYSSIAYGQPLLDFGTIGASFFRFAIGNIQGYDTGDVQTSVFNDEQYKTTLSYARNIGRGLSAGMNFNMFYSNISSSHSLGFGADAAVLYEPFSFLRGGLMIQNMIKPEFSMDSVSEGISRLYILGLLAKYSIAGFRFMASNDMSIGESENFKDRVGVEINWSGIASVRAGYCDGNYSFGAGLALYNVTFDYAYIANEYLGRMDRFTVSYAFGMTIEEQKAQKQKDILNEVRKFVDQKIKIKIKEEADAHYSAAYQHYQKGEYEEALAEAGKSLEWKNDYEPSIKMKKIVEERLKEQLDKVSKIRYTGVNEQSVLAGIEFYEKKQYDKAIMQWEMALKARPGNKMLKSLISEAGHAMEAGRDKIELTQSEKDQIEKMYYLAVNSYTAGDLKGAIELWKKVLLINPEDVKTMRDLKKAQTEIEELAKRGIQ
jgi:tetratricopeptide (TPR) repeat protein